MCFVALAAAAGQGTVLFVSGEPHGARVIVDGVPIERPTPVLLRSLAPGPHRIELQRPGYHSQEIEVSLAPGTAEIVAPRLRRTGFVAGFPGEPTLLLGKDERQTEGRLWSLAPGTYSFSRDSGERLTVTPRFPLQRLTDALAVAIPIFFGFATYLTADAIANPPDSDRLVPPAVMATHLVTAAMIGTEIWLQVRKQDFLERFALETRAESDPDLEQQTYDQGTQLLQLGSLAEARAVFARIEPGGRLYPDALYKITSIHVTGGAYEQALEGFDRIAAEYPLPELYDRSLKGAADLLLRLGRFSESLDRLSAMTFVDRMYSREEIDAYSCEILARWASQSPDVLPRAIDAYIMLTGTYASSPRIGAYRAALAQLLAPAATPPR
jgi:hypothetical protein